MDMKETQKLLRFIAAIDGRKITNDTIIAWQQILARHDYERAKKAAETAICNAAGKYLEISMVLDVLRADARIAAVPTCQHSVPEGHRCYDCEHADQADERGDWPGEGPAQQAATAELLSQFGTWRDHIDEEESQRLKRAFRDSGGVIYPGETHCPDGHQISEDPIIKDSRGKPKPQCGHPHHQPTREEVDW